MAMSLVVLILEDQEPDAELMVDELRRTGFEPEVIRADNETDFGIALEQNPDVILADYSLPNYDAPAALTLVRDRRLDIPFIIVSGAVSEEVAIECMKKGAADYLLKDRLSRLGPAVRAALEAKRVREQRRLAAQALRISEARYRSLTDDVLDNSAVGLFILDADLTVVWVNKAVQRFFGVGREALLGKDQKWLVRNYLAGATEHPGEFARAVAATYEDNTYTEQFECHILPGPGVEGAQVRRERWVEHLSHPITDGIYRGGRIEHYTDITERKKSEIRQDQLVRQADKRVRDTIADVASAAERAMAAASSIDDFRSTFTERLWAIAKMNELLAQARSNGADLRELVARTLAAAASDPQASTFEGDEVTLPAAAVPALGLALHDLAAGAVSRGVLSDPDGHIDVKWDRRTSGEGADLLHLVWSESSPGAAKPASSPESEALKTRIASELEGSLSMSRDQDKAVFEIVVPLGRSDGAASTP